MRTIDLEPYSAEPALLRFIVGLECARRRVWPQFGKPYDEPAVAYDGREWTLDEIWSHLDDSRREAQEAHAGSERDSRPPTALRLRG